MIKRASIFYALSASVAAVFLSGCTGMYATRSFGEGLSRPFRGFKEVHDVLTAQEHTALGRTYEDGQKPEAAKREYRLALEKDPHYVPALVNYGIVSYQEGDYEKAADLYRRALKEKPHDGRILNNLAWVYISLSGEKPTSGLEENLIAIASELWTLQHAKETQSPVYWDTLGMVYHSLKEAKTSLNCFELALMDAPQADTAFRREVEVHQALVKRGS